MKRIDEHLRNALRNFTANNYANRAKAFSGYDFERLREKLAELRDRALDRNVELLEQFQANAEKHGSKVLRARDSAEANRLILEIMEKHGAKKVVKSKSMVGEETRLNEYLEAHGIEPRETDLGEWIVQLRAERPTHMVLPAIHLTRDDVAEIFAGKLGRKVPREISALVRIAREELRKEIFDTPVGLTGANALIAENGAMMMITNEGNGRLCSTVPPVHIVLASIEKVVPTVSDALFMLRLLPRNATGQIITSYVSFIAGPHRDRQYIILLDNHRSELRADPVFKDVLRCIKCSACLNYCPVYLMLGGSQYSHIYMGGIGSLLTAFIHGLDNAKDMTGLCLGCHRCEEVCATKIPIADLVVKLKERLNDETGKPLLKKIIFDGLFARPDLHEGAFSLARSARAAITGKDDFARKIPGLLNKYDRFRSLPAPSGKSFAQLFTEKYGGKILGAGKGRVKIFAGCLVENFYPQIGLAGAEILAKLGYEVELIPPCCCGFPAANSGFPDAARKAYGNLMNNLDEQDIVITLCPTCTSMLAHKGPELMKNEKAARISKQVFPLSRFLVERESGNLFKMIASAGATFITFHESCHSAHLLKSSEATREIIRGIAGSQFVEMKTADSCCGFAGAFSLDHPELSEVLLTDKLGAIKASGAEIVAVDCPGCLMQIQGGCHKQGMNVRAKHIAEILSEVMK